MNYYSHVVMHYSMRITKGWETLGETFHLHAKPQHVQLQVTTWVRYRSSSVNFKQPLPVLTLSPETPYEMEKKLAFINFYLLHLFS